MRIRATTMSLPTLALLANVANAEAIQLTFVDHIQAGMIEQDVFVRRDQDSSLGFRVTSEDYEKYLEHVVHTSAVGVPHDPMNTGAMGPYEIGFNLGVTLQEWLDASGKATYRCHGSKGAISIEFEKLVPNGLYTLWTFYLPTPFTEPFSTYDIPIGARDGSDSVFRADPTGAANLTLEIEPCLQGSSNQLASGLAAAYHSDGKTYGPEPGSMGDKTHVHLFALLPNVEEMPN